MNDINFVALIACGIAAMVVGFIWYSKAVFGKLWQKGVGLSDADIKKGGSNPTIYIGMFVGALIQAYVLSILLRQFGANDFMSATQVAFWAWLGFVAVVKLSDVLFEQKSWNLFGINTGYQLVNMIVMSLILVSF